MEIGVMEGRDSAFTGKPGFLGLTPVPAPIGPELNIPPGFADFGHQLLPPSGQTAFSFWHDKMADIESLYSDTHASCKTQLTEMARILSAKKMEPLIYAGASFLANVRALQVGSLFATMKQTFNFNWALNWHTNMGWEFSCPPPPPPPLVKPTPLTCTWVPMMFPLPAPFWPQPQPLLQYMPCTCFWDMALFPYCAVHGDVFAFGHFGDGGGENGYGYGFNEGEEEDDVESGYDGESGLDEESLHESEGGSGCDGEPKGGESGGAPDTLELEPYKDEDLEVQAVLGMIDYPTVVARSRMDQYLVSAFPRMPIFGHERAEGGSFFPIPEGGEGSTR